MGSLHSPPQSQYDAASGGVVFLKMNQQLALWVVKEIEKIGSGNGVGMVIL